jgi:16S rRNA C967 or C1407 C5-methylase (RsmB/RsmF family)/NOL1/NOP2/fmu family ribosome biogenesis protein
MLPQAFLNRIQLQFKEDANAFVKAIETESHTSIRLNPAKKSNAFSGDANIPWCNEGRMLHERPVFIADPLWHAGVYYVQESSSMFLKHVYNTIAAMLPNEVRILDLCAAPGGKSTLLASLLGNSDLLVSNEVIKNRVGILLENLTRWGTSQAVITNNAAADFAKLGHYFDVIVVDAPCSGEGMFRKDKNAILEWSESHVELCASRQKNILRDVLPALKPGGFLIYSTCTFNEQENEQQVLALINKGYKSVKIPIEEEWGIEEITTYASKPLFGYKFLPHKVLGEGLFMACLQKSEDDNIKRLDIRKYAQTISLNEITSAYLNQPEKFVMQKGVEQLVVYPIALAQEMIFLQHQLNVRQSGLKMGEMMKNKLIPDYALALSSQLSKEVSRTDLDLQQSIAYLRRQAPQVNLFSITGWQTVSYLDYPLGWVNVLSNRVNNYLPLNMRILKEL